MSIRQLNQCFVCGNYYIRDSIIPMHTFDKEKNRWNKMTNIQYKDKEIPLCSTCFRMAMMLTSLHQGWRIDLGDENDQK